MDNEIKFSIECAGYCSHSNHITDSSISYCNSKIIKFPSLFGIFKHAKFGYILYDTGYSNRFFQETLNFPFSYYGKLTPVNVNQSASDVLQKKYKIENYEINFIIISHFHADHISGLLDFPNAKFIYSKEGFEFLLDKKKACTIELVSNVKCCMNGFIPNLLPNNFEERSWKISLNEFSKIVNLPFKVFDLFGDGSIYIVNLPGHCLGHFGVFINSSNSSNNFNFNNTDDKVDNIEKVDKVESDGVVEVKKQQYLFVGDAAWSTRAIKLNALPHVITKYLVQYDWSDYVETLQLLHDLYNESNCYENNSIYQRNKRTGTTTTNRRRGGNTTSTKGSKDSTTTTTATTPPSSKRNNICIIPSHCWQVYEQYCCDSSGGGECDGEQQPTPSNESPTPQLTSTFVISKL